MALLRSSLGVTHSVLPTPTSAPQRLHPNPELSLIFAVQDFDPPNRRPARCPSNRCKLPSCDKQGSSRGGNWSLWAGPKRLEIDYPLNMSTSVRRHISYSKQNTHDDDVPRVLDVYLVIPLRRYHDFYYLAMTAGYFRFLFPFIPLPYHALASWNINIILFFSGGPERGHRSCVLTCFGRVCYGRRPSYSGLGSGRQILLLITHSREYCTSSR